MMLAVGLVTGLASCAPKIEGGRGTGQIPQLGTATNSGEQTDDFSDCRTLEVEPELGWRSLGNYTSIIDEDEELGDDDEDNPDFFTLELRSPQTGEFDLGDDDNLSYAECRQCLIVSQDNGDKFLFQVSGTLEVDDDARPHGGEIDVEVRDVVLVEVDIDEETLDTDIVEDGECVRIEDTDLEELVIPKWTCPSGFYGAGDGCDCGCGKFDPDCVNDSADACEFCDAPGSCNESSGLCPGGIDEFNNAKCDPESVWTCDFATYDAGDGCDCGCGVVDPDCQNARNQHCDSCDLEGSCLDPADGVSCTEGINAVNNSLCTPFIGWTCDPTFYDAKDGCDCGCGLEDPDCIEAEGADDCQWCSEIGSCAEGEGGDACKLIKNSNTGACR